MDHEPKNGKVSGVRHIVRLKELLHKWHHQAQRHHHHHHHPRGIPPQVSRRLIRSATITSDSEDEGSHSPEPPHDVPKGYLAIYVGSELRRFIIPTTYLSHKLFKTLLEKVEEEYGFDHSGALTIPCEVETFKYLLKCIENEIFNGEKILNDKVENENLSKKMQSTNKGLNGSLSKEKILTNNTGHNDNDNDNNDDQKKKICSFGAREGEFLSKQECSTSACGDENLRKEEHFVATSGIENSSKGKSSSNICEDEKLCKGRCVSATSENEFLDEEKRSTNMDENEKLANGNIQSIPVGEFAKIG